MSIDGFAVDLDVVSGIRSLLDSLTQAHLAARDAEDRGPATAPGPPPVVASAVAVVPSWHRDLDRRWLTQHAALLRTHDAAGTALAETVRAYLDVEATLAASATTPRAAGIAPAVLPALPDTGRDTMVASGQGGAGSGLAGDCEQVAAGWRRRRDLAADTADRITTAVRRLEGWTGPAAETFTVWAGRNLIDRWHALATAADTINRALLDRPATPHDELPDRLHDDGPPPHVPALTTEPPEPFDDATLASAAAAEQARAGSTAPPVSSVEHSPPPAVSTPSHEIGGLVPPPRQPLDPPTVDHASNPANRLDDDRTDTTARPSETSTSPPPATATDDTDTSVETTPTSPTPAPDGSPSWAAPAPMVPTTAAAGAMALARADMAHHVIREITIPPTPPPGPPPAPGQGTDATLAAPHRPHPPAPPTSPAPDPGPAATRPTVHPTGVGLPWRTRSRADRHARPAMWVNLHPHTPAGVWVDLAAHRGLGLDGPGAHAVTRTAIAELHTHTATRIIGVRAVIDEFLPHGDAGTDASVEGVDPGGVIQVVDDPYDGLQHLADHARGTRMGCSPCPCLLIAPAPTDPGARDHLAATLDRLPGPAAALLVGLWPGTGLHIDPDHRVRAHRRPRGADLTGRQLHPTEPVDLARLLTQQERTAETESHDQKTTTSPAEPAETPLRLSVLGPVTLTYRTTETSHGDPDVVVEPIPRLGRELLAYLAAHPHGATRDHLIDTLCPDTTSRRPETTLHSALSRLRRALIDTTTDPDTAEIVTTGPRWTLNPAVVTVDHWELLATTTTITEPAARRAALHRVAGSYTDLYAVDVPGLWAHTIRESTRRRYLQIINELVDIELQHDDAHAALRLLEHARTLEPRNDTIARAIITLQLRADRTTDAQATYELLRTELAAIDAEPEPRTRRLIEAASAPGEPRPDRRRR